MSLVFFELYGPERDFGEIFRSRDIRQVHVSLQEMDPLEATRQMAAFIQSWLYFGLFGSICARPIPASYMVRTGSDGEAYSYIRTLPILLEAWARCFLAVKAEYRDETQRKADKYCECPNYPTTYAHLEHWQDRTYLQSSYPKWRDLSKSSLEDQHHSEAGLLVPFHVASVHCLMQGSEKILSTCTPQVGIPHISRLLRLSRDLTSIRLSKVESTQSNFSRASLRQPSPSRRSIQ